MHEHALSRLILGAVVVAGFVLGVGLGSRVASSQPSDSPAPPPSAPTLAHQPFTPYAADDGALSFDQLDEREQAAIVAQRNRETPDTLAARFEMMKVMTIARGERTHAEVAASMIGLEGFGTEGVVP